MIAAILAIFLENLIYHASLCQYHIFCWQRLGY